MKTSELTGAALDWAVLMAEGDEDTDFEYLLRDYLQDPGRRWLHHNTSHSTSWESGGPLIEQERITVSYADAKQGFMAMSYDAEVVAFGPTYLISAMRCFVASKLGDSVEVPQELI